MAAKKADKAELLPPATKKFPELDQPRYEEILTGLIKSGAVGIYGSGIDKGKRFVNVSEKVLVDILNQLYPDNKIKPGSDQLPDPRRL